MRIVATMNPVLLMAVLLLSGCSSIHFESLQGSLFSPAYWPGLSADRQTEDTRAEIERAVAGNDLEQAQKLLLDSRQKQINEEPLADLYTAVGNRLLDEAERIEVANRPDSAGMLFRMALEIYPSDRQLQTTFKLSRQEIEFHIEQCADSLMKAGMIAYRSGELVSAIKLWQEISRFHPDHRASRIAILTAEQQLENLEKLTSNNAM